MPNWAGIANELRSLQATDEKKQAAATKAKGRLQEKVRELAELCRPHCLAAIEHYNVQAPYKIVPDTINIGFNLEKQTLLLGVQLKTDAGYEPDESYSFEEEK